MLSIKNLHASIGEKEILKGINLEVKAGEVHAIMGPNGSGKSTLLKNLLGLKQTKPGTIFMDDKDITTNDNYLLDIGFVFQNYNIIDSYSVLEK